MEVKRKKKKQNKTKQNKTKQNNNNNNNNNNNTTYLVWGGLSLQTEAPRLKYFLP